MPDAPFGCHVFGEPADPRSFAPQHRDLHAGVVVEMHMHSCDRQVVVIVERARQPVRQVAAVVVVHVGESRSAAPGHRALGRELMQP